MIYLGAEDYYFWLGVQDSVLKSSPKFDPKYMFTEYYDKTFQINLTNAYSFGYLLGKEIDAANYNYMLNEGQDYLKLFKNNYLEEIL